MLSWLHTFYIIIKFYFNFFCKMHKPSENNSIEQIVQSKFYNIKGFRGFHIKPNSPRTI